MFAPGLIDDKNALLNAVQRRHCRLQAGVSMSEVQRLYQLEAWPVIDRMIYKSISMTRLIDLWPDDITLRLRRLDLVMLLHLDVNAGDHE